MNKVDTLPHTRSRILRFLAAQTYLDCSNTVEPRPIDFFIVARFNMFPWTPAIGVRTPREVVNVDGGEGCIMRKEFWLERLR